MKGPAVKIFGGATTSLLLFRSNNCVAFYQRQTPSYHRMSASQFRPPWTIPCTATQAAGSDRGGDSRKRLIEEVEAMGGDPFFLDDIPQEDCAENEDSINDEAEDVSITLDMFSEMAMAGGTGALGLIQGRLGLEGEDTGELTKDDNSKHPGETATISKAKDRDEDIFESAIEEILAYGGDPAFFGSVDDSIRKESQDEEYDEVLANGGDPFFLGEAPEDIPLDAIQNFRESLSTTTGTKDGASAMDVLSNLVDFAAMTNPSQFSGEDETASMQTEGEQEPSLLDEIESMGGDPSFLDSPVITPAAFGNAEKVFSTATDGKGPSQSFSERRLIKDDDAKWEWDGVVDENAHLD